MSKLSREYNDDSLKKCDNISKVTPFLLSLGNYETLKKPRDFRLTMGLYKVKAKGRSIYFKDKQIIDL